MSELFTKKGSKKGEISETLGRMRPGRREKAGSSPNRSECDWLVLSLLVPVSVGSCDSIVMSYKKGDFDWGIEISIKNEISLLTNLKKNHMFSIAAHQHHLAPPKQPHTKVRIHNIHIVGWVRWLGTTGKWWNAASKGILIFFYSS